MTLKRIISLIVGVLAGIAGMYLVFLSVVVFEGYGVPEAPNVETGILAAHPALLVEDLSALKTLIESAGYTVKTDEPLESYDRIYVEDPFGNRIELMEQLSN
jgi:hypothetical protein